ncbi:uncharacterized protein LAESUDRAFT_335360 [Laetiporus sulphureus 93-53]|uniref:F-box domain-containing protein n=1 Tax=Laetiporus sulphureus 93-53 TaxID=1314785 RepID=A0A165CVS5_9APHY|nr:uncharacterized protein LAESUDRAFT_335360 [Laetiporus sulphureus 93-53]KZT03525.1 hypothetical protein LAESUDRAFT_335360 [Laetiporus sulphureus 93-53]
MTVAIPRLPLELHDCILDCLVDDRRALATCSLVCRAWLPTARSHLFHAVTLSGSAQGSRFQELVQQSPYIGRYVRKLALVKPWNECGRPSHLELPQILTHLDSVEDLSVERWSDAGLCEALKEHYANTVTMRLTSVEYKERDMQTIICACPKLQALYLSGVTICPDGLSAHLQPVVPARPITLKTLYWKTPPTAFADWLIHGPLELRLSKLGLATKAQDPVSTGYVQSLLEAAGTHLESLVLSVWQGFHASLSPGLLAHNPNLTSLHITNVAPHPSLSHPWAGLRTALSDVQPVHRRLSHISVTILPIDHLCVALADWEQIDVELERIARERPWLAVTFCVVNIAHSPVEWMPQVVDTVVHCLPLFLAAKGRLSLMWFNGWDEYTAYGGEELAPWF